ncbi:MAG: VIT and vWA domain-containing protein [Planctomycetota bacterium]|jgi:Ca-activated chloride channel family protein
MSRRPLLSLSAALTLIALSATSLLADGFIVIRRPPRRPTPVIPLAVKYHHVAVKIEDPLAVTEIDQVFRNPNPIELEGEYIFPLPEGSVVTKFTMYMNGKEVEGEILDADKARAIYQSIVQRKRDPALLEYLGTRMFRAKVFPIPARGETRIGLKYSEMVQADAGLRTYRYPLNTEKFSSKPLESVVVGVEIKTKEALKNVYSPSHNVEVIRKGENTAKASYEARNLKPDQDFVLYYATSPDEFGLNVATYAPRRQDGFFLLMLSPKVEVTRVQPKDVIFVIDTSLSMVTDNDAMDAAKKTLKYCVQSLRPQDRFNILDFSMEVRRLFEDGLEGASGENVEEALAYIDAMRARGATAISDALQAALELGKGSTDRPCMIVFLTDGTPTWGAIRDPKKIREHVKKLNTMKARIFTFGIGTDIDSLFLDRLARENHGTREFVTGKEDLELKVTRFFDKVSHPILSDLQLSVEGLRIMDVYPKPLPDLFKGDQIAVLGRYRGKGAHAITLSGKVGKNTHRYVYEAKFEGTTNGGEFIPRFWASLKIGHLLEEIRLHGVNKELKDEIVRLSKKYGIMNNPYVSFLVVEDQPLPTASRAPGFGAFRRRAEAEDEGQGGAGSGLNDLEAREAKGGARAGRAIDKAKKGLHSGESLLKVSEKIRKLVKYVKDRTFYLEKGVWTDSGYDGKAEVTEVKFMSDAYFQLLSDHPGIGKFLAVGDQVLVVVDGKAFRILKE